MARRARWRDFLSTSRDLTCACEKTSACAFVGLETCFRRGGCGSVQVAPTFLKQVSDPVPGGSGQAVLGALSKVVFRAGLRSMAATRAASGTSSKHVSDRHRRRRRMRSGKSVFRLLGSNGRMRCDCIQATRRRPRVRSCASSLLERYRLNRDRSGSEWRGGGAAALATTAREERERWRSGAEPRTQYEGQTSSGIRRSPEAGPTEKRFCVSTAISGRVRCRRLFIGLSDMYGRAATRPWLARCFSLTLEDGRSPTSPPEIDSTRGVLTSGHDDI
jgi:hypothetical protein